jgi:hypothetical protein
MLYSFLVSLVAVLVGIGGGQEIVFVWTDWE